MIWRAGFCLTFYPEILGISIWERSLTIIYRTCQGADRGLILRILSDVSVIGRRLWYETSALIGHS